MSTQFFEHQERARRNTTRLVFIFCLAAVAIALSLYVIAAVATGFRGTDPITQRPVFEIVWLDPLLMFHVGLLTLVVVIGVVTSHMPGRYRYYSLLHGRPIGHGGNG